MVMGNALWQLIKESDSVSQFVLLLLLGMSIACWAIFFYKFLLMRSKKQNLAAARVQLQRVHTLEQLVETAPRFGGTVAGYFLSRNLNFLKGLLEQQKGTAGLSQQDWEFMEHHMQQTLDDMIMHEESYQPVLSTCAGIATLLGLFGTIWGLIHAFVRISQQHTADIATVAPGIAEALITTLAGLIVAIPALVMFSYVNVQVRAIEQQLMALADHFTIVVKKQLVRSHPIDLDAMRTVLNTQSGGHHAAL